MPTDVNGWHAPARQIRRLQLAQAIALAAACLTSVILVMAIGRTILRSASDQERAHTQLRELADMRSGMLVQQTELLQRQLDGAPLIDPSFFADYAVFRDSAIRLASERAGGNSREAVQARTDILNTIDDVDAAIARAVAQPDTATAIARDLQQPGGPGDILSRSMDRWLDAATAEVNAAVSDGRDLSTLLWWIIGLVGGVGAVSVALWFWLDRARSRLVASLRASEERFRSLVQNSSDTIMIVDAGGTIRYASQPAERLVGHHPADLVDRQLMELVHPDDVGAMSTFGVRGVAVLETNDPIEWQIRHRDGSSRFVETIAARRMDDPAVSGYVLNTRDVTDRKEVERQLAHRAFHDVLTDLANRALFEDRVTHALSIRRRDDHNVSVLLLDLDDFKTVNDSLGHAAGDALLIAVADRLKTSLRSSDTAARLGGDEFAVLVETATDLDEVKQLAERIVEQLREPIRVLGRDIVVQASIGIAVATEPTATSASLLREADLAMYLAKDRGRAGYAVFDPTMARNVSERLELSTDLHRAIDRGELHMVYQPIVEIATGRTVAVEALMRWDHPIRGLVEPNVFIPLAEDTGTIVPLGTFALRRAMRDAATWTTPLGQALRVSVNVSIRQIEDPAFAETVRTALAETGFPPHRLVLEITESALMRDPEAMLEQIIALRELGVTLAIDDFGTGYSSLSYLARLPIDYVKIDRSFVDGLSAGYRDARIAGMIVGIGDSLQVGAVAEGVETAEQVAELRELGCLMAQGYHYSRPKRAGDLEAALTDPSPVVSS